jgi:hypothetical protein
VSVPASSLASQLPQYPDVSTKPVNTFDLCGSWLASDGVSEFNAIKPLHSRTFRGLTTSNRQLSLPVLFFVAGVVDAFFHG